jgi:MtN3 and saliva related transmembrane protein
MVTILGLVAGVLTTGAWFPQVMRSWRTRSTGDISWTYLTVLTAGVALWSLYGVLMDDGVIVAANVITAVALLVLAVFKVRFEGTARAAARENERVSEAR